jgi:ABC-type oligopeptide transport system substrate-binding subunit
MRRFRQSVSIPEILTEFLKSASDSCEKSDDRVEYASKESNKAFADILAAESIKYEIVLTDAAGLDSAIAKGDADLWFERVYDGATVDKFDYFNSLGLRNRTSLSLPTVDALTERIRQSTGFEDRTTALKDLLALVMSEAVEYPVCQLQKLTLYNTEKISAETFDEFNFDGYNYALCELKSV